MQQQQSPKQQQPQNPTQTDTQNPTKTGLQTFRNQSSNYTLQLQLYTNQGMEPSSQPYLQITLCDYTDWIVYGKSYREADVGRDLHRKVDIFDVYQCMVTGCQQSTLSQSKTHQQIGSVNSTNDKATNIQSKKSCEPSLNRKYYKIDSQGRITVYCLSIDQKTNKSIYHQSNLKLNIIRKMNQIQIMSKKMLLEKEQFHNKYWKKIYAVEEKCKGLGKECTQLKSELKSVIGLVGVVKQDVISEMQQIRHLYQQFVSSTNKIIQQQEQALKQHKKQLDQAIKRIKKLQQNPNKQTKTLNNLTFTSQVNFNKFKLNGTQISYIGDNNWTQIYFTDSIPYQSDQIYKFKIIAAQGRHIMIGVIDFQKQKNQRFSQNSKNSIYYFGNGGTIYSTMKSEGGGFGQGDQVSFTVNLKNKLIKWSVNGAIKASAVFQPFVDQSRIFVPSIEMYYPNSKVQRIY